MIPMPSRNGSGETMARAVSRHLRQQCSREWGTVQLGDVADVASGGTPDTGNPAYWDGETVWVTPKDLGRPRDVEILDSERRITERGLARSSARLLPAGTVILSSRAPIGHLAVAAAPLATNQGCKSITCHDSLQSRFLFHVLRGSIDELQSQGRGNTFVEIPAKVVKAFQVPVPPRDVQTVVADFVDKFYLRLGGKQVDLPHLPEPMNEVRQIVLKVERLATSAQAVIARSRSNGGKVEDLWSATLASVFPEAADKVLGDFAAVQSGYAFKSEWFEAEGIRLVRNVNIGHGTLAWNQQVCIAEGRRSEFGRFELRLGDILVSLDRPIISTGVKVARMRQVDLPSLLLQRVGRLLIRTPDLDPDYLYLWLRSPRFVNAIDPGRSNGVPHISPKDIERLPFAAPTLANQRGIVARLHRLEGIVLRAVSARSIVVTEAEAILTSALRDAFETPAPDRSACA